MIKITKAKKGIWVTFISDEDVVLKGSWNNWIEQKMKKRKDGKYSISKVLKKGTYEFGYLSQKGWIIEKNLPTTDNPYGGKNSILKI